MLEDHQKLRIAFLAFIRVKLSGTVVNPRPSGSTHPRAAGIDEKNRDQISWRCADPRNDTERDTIISDHRV
ncbi:unnamed protein product [Leptosia nina]|uniref:Uncharacterized protein n=1 Tax=Leptosia nina TaxID=320188 RepID=A0AAV1J7M1_9NEOP